MADNANVEDGDNRRFRETLKQLRKERDEENEARALLEEMQQNLEAHARASETERILCLEHEDYMYSWDREVGRPNNLSAKNWQIMQSNNMKLENLEKDFAGGFVENAPTGVERSGKTNQSLSESP